MSQSPPERQRVFRSPGALSVEGDAEQRDHTNFDGATRKFKLAARPSFPGSWRGPCGVLVRSLPVRSSIAGGTLPTLGLRKPSIQAAEFEACGIVYSGGVRLRISVSRAVRGAMESHVWVRHRNGSNELEISPYRDRENEATIQRNRSIVPAARPSVSKSRERTQVMTHRDRENEATIVRNPSIV